MSSTKNMDDSIFVVGSELLLEFGQLLYELLERDLKARWGSDWLESCVENAKGRERFAEPDLHFLLKQIVDRNNQNFRTALALQLFGQIKLTKAAIDHLVTVQDLRNKWAHPATPFSFKDLKKLSNSMYSIIGNEHALGRKCSQIMKLSEDQDLSSKVASFSHVFSQSKGFVDNLIEETETKNATIIELQQLLGMIKKESSYEPGSLMYQVETEDIRRQLLMVTHATMDFLSSFLLASIERSMWQAMAISLYRRTKVGKLEISKAEFDSINKGEELLKEFTNWQSLRNEMNEDRIIEKCDCLYCRNFAKEGPRTILATSELQLTIQKIAKKVRL